MEESIGDERSDDKGSDEYAEEAFDDDDLDPAQRRALAAFSVSLDSAHAGD